MAQAGSWSHGVCGCFDNCGLCVISYFVPCYQFGKNAEALGHGCCAYGCLFFVPIANLFVAAGLRGEIRQQKGIDGTYCNDLMLWCCCNFCALVQEAQELQGDTPGGQFMARH